MHAGPELPTIPLIGDVFRQYVLMTVSDVLKINPSHSVPSQVLCQEGLLMESSLIELNVSPMAFLFCLISLFSLKHYVDPKKKK